ncbi:transglycosylase domain-containing protein [Planococcus sp. APC 4015]|nr:transglycosylase domain-containing protein [Planococcus sp. APC 4015]
MPDTKRTASGVLGGLAGLVGLSAVAGVLVTATVTPAIAVSGAAASSAIEMFDNLPSVLDIDKLMLPTTLYTKNPTTGEYEEWTQFFDQNRSPVEFDEVSPALYDAILSSEDPRYYQHGGVDLIGTTRALLSNLRGGGETQGGSSISQQYVKNVLVQQCEAAAVATEDLTREQVLANCFNESTTASGAEGIQRKLQEMRYAISLEQKYSKNDILLGYLNIANFGGQTYGIDAAARYYFGVSAAELSVSQAATLAGMVQNPNTYRIDKPGGSIVNAEGVGFNKAPDGLVDDINTSMFGPLQALVNDGTITQEQFVASADGYSAAKGRQLYVLSRLLGDGKITQEQYTAAVIEPITPNITQPKTGCAAATGAEYFCQYVRMVIENDPAFGETYEERTQNLRRGGLKVYTTLDWNLQNAARETLAANAPSSIANMNFGSSTVSVDNTNGNILQITQNTYFRDGDNAGDPNYSSIVYAGDSKFGGSQGFSVGSTFKLFTLIAWLEAGKSVNETINGTVRPPKRMTNSCLGDWVNTANWKPNNFGQGNGYVGTPMRFTRESLNSGYVAMAAQLDLCDIAKVTKKMGVTLGNGQDIPMANANEVIGSDAVSPLAMASAYGTVANNGIYCQPTPIAKVEDSDGNEIAKPERTCTQVLDPSVAATAAYALEGVMNGGTGAGGKPRDNVPVLGKTGTHEQLQTWLVESSTRVATAVWVGQSIGEANVFRQGLQNKRYTIARGVQSIANAFYGGTAFAKPDTNLTKVVLTDLPSVVGQTVDAATRTLTDAGFEVSVGAPVDSTEVEGLIASQNPGAGKIGSGSLITIYPSNGQGLTIPSVSGSLADAKNTLRSAGFSDVKDGTCSEDGSLNPNDQRATSVYPAAGTVANRGAALTVNYSARDCG